MGRKWLGLENTPSQVPEHAIHNWFSGLAAQWKKDRLKAKVSKDGTFEIVPSIDAYAVRRLGYELFILGARNVDATHVIKDLRRANQFLGTRFEIAIGAFLCIAGFEVEYLKPKKGQKSPDIKALHPRLSSPIHVEVKRKHRFQSKHGGPIDGNGNWRLRIRDRLVDGLIQLKTVPRPWCICIDLDLGFPMPAPNNQIEIEAFLDAIIYESKEAAQKVRKETGDFPLDAPDLLILSQVPYNNEVSYSPGRPYQFLFVTSESSPFLQDYHRIVMPLQMATEQFNRVPQVWEHLRTGSQDG